MCRRRRSRGGRRAVGRFARAGRGVRFAAITAAAAVLLVFAPLARAAGQEPLRAQWHLDQNCDNPCGFTDSSGNGLTAQGNGGPGSGPAFVSDGRFGGALRFPTKADLLNAGDHSLLQPPHVTLIAWVRKSSTPGTVEVVADQGASGGCSHASYALYTGGSADTAGLRFYIWNGTSIAVSPAAGNTMWDGHWHMAAGTYDGTTVRLYIDGTQVGSGTPASGNIGYGLASSNDFTIGNTTDSSCVENTNFSGDIDETRVYSRALTAGEISTLANPSATTPPELPPDSSGTPPGGGGSPPPGGGSPPLTLPVFPGRPFPTFRGPPRLEADKPMIFDASQTTNASSLVWDLNGDGKGDVSCPSSQPYLEVNFNSLRRFRLARAGGAHAASFTAAMIRMSASGPGGFASVTSQIALDTNTNLSLPPKAARTLPETATCAGNPAAFEDALNPLGIHRNCEEETVTFDITEVQGCFRKAQSRDDVPEADRGLWDEYVAKKQQDQSDCLNAANQSTDFLVQVDGRLECRYGAKYVHKGVLVAVGTVTINGLKFEPAAGHSIVVSDYLEQVASDRAVALFGRMRFAPLPGSGAVSNPSDLLGNLPAGPIDVDLHAVSVPDWLTGPGERPNAAHVIVSFDGTQDLPRIGGFSLNGQIDLALARQQEHRYSVGRARLELPGDFTVFRGQPPVGEVHLIADNNGGPSLDVLDLSLPYAELPPVTLSDVRFRYDRHGQPGPPFNCNGNFWKATASVFIGTDDPDQGQAGFSLSDQPPYPPNAVQNGVGFCGAGFSHAGGSVVFGGFLPKPEVFPGIFVNDINLGVQLQPALVRGGLTLSVADLSEVTGDFLSIFATPDQPYALTAADGPGFAQVPAAGNDNARGSRLLTGTTLAAGGSAKLTLPGLNDVTLGGAYALYSFPDYVAFGGSSEVILPGLRLHGQLDGELSAHDARFNLKGSVEGCFLEDILKSVIGCQGVTAWVSDNGVAACVGDPTNPDSGGPHPGLGASLNVFRLHLHIEPWFPDGCKPSHFWDNTIAAPSAHAAQAGLTFRIARGERFKRVRLYGAGAAPRVRVRSPDGETISTDEGGFAYHGTLSVLQADGDRTYIGVLHGPPGTYTITPLPGSARITRFSESRQGGTELRAFVAGRGRGRVIHYSVGDLTGRSVTFFELGGSTYRVLGRAHRGKGTIRFTPGVGPGGTREIVARSMVDGVPAPEEVVAHFRAPSRVKPGRVRHVRLRRRGGMLIVSWAKASDATAYGVVVMQQNGVQRVRIVKPGRHSVRFTQVSSAWRGTVTVVARGPTDQWDPHSAGKARFRATTRPFTVLRDFRKLGHRRHKKKAALIPALLLPDLSGLLTR